MNRLKILREEKGLFQSDIAKVLGISSAAVGFYETGKRDMNTVVLTKLADYFECSIDYLLGKSDIRNPEKVDINNINIAFSSGYEGLNDTNKEIAQNIIAGLLAKQKNEEEKNINQ